MDEKSPVILVLGASGLIGESVAQSLRRRGFAAVAIARRFTPAQRAAFGAAAVECPIAGFTTAELADLLSKHSADIVVNCIGVLQDSIRSGLARDIHGGFVERLVAAIAAERRPCLLMHLSVPGRAEDDRTAFSASKREAERIVAASAVPFAILRPGFVVAATAYGGSALIRSLAATPFLLPEELASRPFAATGIGDLADTVAVVARRWQAGERAWSATWDVMERDPADAGAVIAAFRRHFGGPPSILRLPLWLMTIGAKLGDLSAYLGWSPPVRSTALEEMRRGVAGDPSAWIAATGIEPASLQTALERIPATIQEKWFARLYLIKPVVVGTLAGFWLVSGLIALTVAFSAATAMLSQQGFPPLLAQAMTAVTSLADIAIGITIAFRRTARIGLAAGICLSLGYLLGATLIASGIWIEPLGSLVKTVPAILLMVVAAAMLDDR